MKFDKYITTYVKSVSYRNLLSITAARSNSLHYNIIATSARRVIYLARSPRLRDRD